MSSLATKHGLAVGADRRDPQLAGVGGHDPRRQAAAAGRAAARKRVPRAHDMPGLVGLAIGQGLPLAAGAAIACPDRPVICLEADGSAMYTLSALWVHARERLDITTVVLNNKAYAILQADLDFVALSEGMGVPATTGQAMAEPAASAHTSHHRRRRPARTLPTPRAGWRAVAAPA